MKNERTNVETFILKINKGDKSKVHSIANVFEKQVNWDNKRQMVPNYGNNKQAFVIEFKSNTSIHNNTSSIGELL